VVKTHERPKCLSRLLHSIHEHAPDTKVVVVDDSRRAEEAKSTADKAGLLKLAGGVDYVAAEYDVGVAAGRNIGVNRVTTRFTVMLDDDFVFTNETQLDQLIKVVSSGDADIAGGELYVVPDDLKMGLPIADNLLQKRRVVVSGAFSLAHDKKRRMLGSRVAQLPKDHSTCVAAQMVSNFFVAKTDTLKQLKWDPDLKLSEAEDFFLRAQSQGHTIQYCLAVKAMHDGQCTVAQGHDPEAYKLRRERSLHFQQKFFNKYQLQQYSTPYGGLYLYTCAFGPECNVGHVWKKDEMRTCNGEGRCQIHKIAFKQHPGTRNMRLFKCDDDGKNCNKPVMG